LPRIVSSLKQAMLDPMIDRTSRLVLRRAAALGSCLAAVLMVAACGGGSDNEPDANPGPTPDAPPVTIDAPAACNPANPAPTYTELYTKYFAAGKPGHCATAGCHSDPDHTTWLCGPNKESCYAGMVGQGLISMANPIASIISDPKRSPIRWVNPNGGMPADSSEAFNEGRDAIIAWVGACAQNN
jgi:hypothetical protein